MRLFLLLSLLPVSAFAEPTKVFYVGGYRASPAQMRCWEAGARKNSSGDFEFEGVAYPAGAGAGYSEAVNGASADIHRVVAEINAHPNKKYVIAGHSSGAAISNTIAGLAQNPARIKLVDLDGFTPPQALRDRLGAYSCWAARTPAGLKSRNYSAMTTCGHWQAYVDNHCSTSWCLHFSLAVKSTPANLGTDFPVRGYEGCDSNLSWLAN